MKLYMRSNFTGAPNVRTKGVRCPYILKRGA